MFPIHRLRLSQRLLTRVPLIALLLTFGACSSSAPPMDDELDAGLIDDGSTPDPVLPPDPSLPIPASIETQLASSEVRSGEAIDASCIIFDKDGEELNPSDYQI